MLSAKGIIVFIAGMLVAAITLAQHPDLKIIDSLRKVLPTKHGIERIDNLTSIGEECWWPVPAAASNILAWANPAYRESVALHYSEGKAKSLLLLGVAKIFSKNFDEAEKYLRESLGIYDTLKSDFGMGWCNVWLGQALFSQDKFDEALVCQKKSIFFFEKSGDWKGRERPGRGWA